MDEDEAGRPKWRGMEFAGISALVATVTCLFIGQTVVHYAAETIAPPIETSRSPTRFNAIDYGATAVIKGQSVIIGPCDTQKP